MKVSVVICTYADERYEHVLDTIESVLVQTYENIEIVVIVDGNSDLFDRLRDEIGDRKRVAIYCNDENRGISYSRTEGAERASGEVVAFIDDDAIADPEWIETLVTTYERTDALAVGGRMIGCWLAGRPWYLPEEFYWLVGVTYPGFAEAGEEVRNTFESNISFRRDVFLELGGYNTNFGPDAESYSHSEGAEIGRRLQTDYGQGVIYDPDAIVEHKVFKDRILLSHLLKRAFQQGVSKRRMERYSPEMSGREESTYLSQLFTHSIPERMKRAVKMRSAVPIGEAVMLVIFTASVGIGYLFATVTRA